MFNITGVMKGLIVMKSSYTEKLIIPAIIIMCGIVSILVNVISDNKMKYYIDEVKNTVLGISENQDAVNQDITYEAENADYTDALNSGVGQENNINSQAASDGMQNNISSTQTSVSENIIFPENCSIRVLLTGDSGYFHQKFELSFQEDYYIQNGQEVYYGEAGTPLNESDIARLLDRQESAEEGRICLTVGVLKEGEWDQTAEMNLRIGSDGETETYQGTLTISKADQNTPGSQRYYLVNTLPMENYLYYVLPSEMPSDYPEEALKAQAICARSYAMIQMMLGKLTEYGADVDDTASFQVYHAVGTTQAAIDAVNATAGQYISYNGEPIEAFYYACSCGHSTTADIWKNAFERDYSYLTEKDYGTLEQESPWYIWTYQAQLINRQMLKNRLIDLLNTNAEYIKIYEFNSSGEEREIANHSQMRSVLNEIGTVQDLEIIERLSGDVVNILKITAGRYHILVEGEYNIRKVLTADEYILIKQDLSESDHLSMVPSGFFELQTVKENGDVIGYILKGGGFGHGVGMSQYGARYLAEQGRDYEYILTYYYENVTIK